MKKLLLTILMLLLLSSVSFAQGEYFGKGTSTIGVAFGKAFDDGESTNSYQFGISLNGNFDIVVATISDRYGDQVAAIGGTYHILNSAQANKFKLAFVGSYASSEELFTLGSVFHTDLKLGNTLFLKPFSGVGLVRFERSDARVTYQAGLDFYFKNNKSIFSVSPQIVKFRQETNFGIQLAIVFDMN